MSEPNAEYVRQDLLIDIAILIGYIQAKAGDGDERYLDIAARVRHRLEQIERSGAQS